MTFGFVVAMEKEAKFVLNKATIVDQQVFAGKRIYSGQVWGKDFVLIIAGIGKVNASFSTQILIDKFDIDCVINFGLAGGKENSHLKAGEIVQVEKVCQYDFDLSELDDVNIGYMQDYDLTFYPVEICKKIANKYPATKCATGDRFTSQSYFLNIIKNLDAQITDMELGAIAQTCFANQKPCYSLKLISDVDGSNDSIFLQYANNSKTICDKLPKAMKCLIENIDFY